MHHMVVMVSGRASNNVSRSRRQSAAVWRCSVWKREIRPVHFIARFNAGVRSQPRVRSNASSSAKGDGTIRVGIEMPKYQGVSHWQAVRNPTRAGDVAFVADIFEGIV